MNAIVGRIRGREGDHDAGRQAHSAGTSADRAGAGRRPRLRGDRQAPRPPHLDDHARGDAQRRSHRVPRRPRPPGHRAPRPPAQAGGSPGAAGAPARPRAGRRGRARVRGDADHRLHTAGHAEDDGPGDGVPLRQRQRQPHRVRTRPAPPGQPGVRLQGGRLPGRAGPGPPGTRRVAPRALRHRRRRLVPVHGRQRPRDPSGGRNRTPGRRRPGLRHPGGRAPGEHRPLPRLHLREHRPGRGPGPRGPPHGARRTPEGDATSGSDRPPRTGRP